MKLKVLSPLRHSGTPYKPGAIAEINDQAVVDSLVANGVVEVIEDEAVESVELQPKPLVIEHTEPKHEPKHRKAKATESEVP